MIRFIDLTGQIYLDEDEENPIKVFAFFDTITDKFLELGESQTWESVKEFIQDYEVFSNNNELYRFLNLIPYNF